MTVHAVYTVVRCDTIHFKKGLILHHVNLLASCATHLAIAVGSLLLVGSRDLLDPNFCFVERTSGRALKLNLHSKHNFVYPFPLSITYVDCFLIFQAMERASSGNLASKKWS